MAKVTNLSKQEEFKCFSYNVNMIIHVFAKNETEAREKLDKEGGFVGKREVSLADQVILHHGK